MTCVRYADAAKARPGQMTVRRSTRMIMARARTCTGTGITRMIIRMGLTTGTTTARDRRAPTSPA